MTFHLAAASMHAGRSLLPASARVEAMLRLRRWWSGKSSFHKDMGRRAFPSTGYAVAVGCEVEVSLRC